MRAVHQRQQGAAVRLAPARRQSVGATHSQSPSRAACGRSWLQRESRACGAEGQVRVGDGQAGTSGGGRRAAGEWAESEAGADRHPGSCDPPPAGMITCTCDPDSRSGAKLEAGSGCTSGQATRRARSCNVCNVQTMCSMPGLENTPALHARRQRGSRTAKRPDTRVDQPCKHSKESCQQSERL